MKRAFDFHEDNGRRGHIHAYYAKPENVPAYTVGEEGQNLVCITTLPRLHVPYWYHAASIRFDIDTVSDEKLRQGALDLGMDLLAGLKERCRALQDVASERSNGHEYVITMPVYGDVACDLSAIRWASDGELFKLDLVVGVVCGLCALPTATTFVHTTFDQFPFESATPEDLCLSGLKVNWETKADRADFVRRVKRKTCEALFGSSILSVR